MAVKLDDILVVGISSRALFDLEEENRIFEEQGLKAYSEYQKAHENDILRPGTAFPLVKALHNLNRKERLTEIIIMSKNSADTSMRIFNSIEHYGLDISRAALVGGAPIEPYLKPFRTDLFLSANEADVQEAINAGIAAARICTSENLSINAGEEIDQIRIAFDGDAVLFSDEAERIYQRDGLDAFIEHERSNSRSPLKQGPFAKLLFTLSYLQNNFGDDKAPIKTALVTARSNQANARVIKTLEAWDIRIDEAFFLGGVEKSEVLDAFGAHIFFDDQDVHLERAASHVPSAKVLGKNN